MSQNDQYHFDYGITVRSGHVRKRREIQLLSLQKSAKAIKKIEVFVLDLKRAFKVSGWLELEEANMFHRE